MASRIGRSLKGRRSRIRRSASLGLAIVMVIPSGVTAQQHSGDFVDKLSRGTTERVSVSSSGGEGDSDSRPNSVSDNGRFVAFASCAGNLHESDVNGQQMSDVFVYDRKKRKLEIASISPNGLSPETPPSVEEDLKKCSVLGSTGPEISADGRYVAFASNLPLTEDVESVQLEYGVPVTNIFVHDLKKKRTELVSRTWNGEGADQNSGNGFWDLSDGISISDDGRWVAFSSSATNILEDPCDPPEPSSGPSPAHSLCHQVYARDRLKQETFLVSRSAPHMPSEYWAGYPSISGDGRYVSFSVVNSLAPVRSSGGVSVIECPPTESGCSDVFVHDLHTWKIELISYSRGGDRPANGPSRLGTTGAQISDDGRYVAFSSDASDLVPSDPQLNATSKAQRTICSQGHYVRDRETGRVERVSVTSAGEILLDTSSPQLSDNGRYALVRASSYNRICLQNATNESDAYLGDFIHDRVTGQMDLVSCAGNNAAGPNTIDGCPKVSDEHGRPYLAGRGQTIVGRHYDGDVVPNDTNNAYDVFALDLGNYPMGLGPLGGSPMEQQDPPDGGICIAPDVCIPPQGKLARSAARASTDPSEVGAKLYGASIAFRPELDDLFVAIEVDHMGPDLTIGPTGFLSGGIPSLLYGFRFGVEDKNYEVRATSLNFGTFGLFDCTDSLACTEVADLRGGYGTTGERVVFSLPLTEVGLENGGELSNVEAFSALGSPFTGATKVLDTVRID